ncbi:MAG: NUDIX domain-containing protein [Simkaniaceae bacterium]|nr:NUDIX domain-containing protein [Simkaniaceae bacterium]
MESSVGAVIFNESRTKVVLMLRSDVPVWVHPGGAIDAGESPEEACIREAYEETGLQVEIVHKVAEYQRSIRITRHTHLFECRIVGGELRPSPESPKVAFFSLDALPYLFPPPHPEWLEDTLENKSETVVKPLKSVTYLALLKRLFTHPHLVLRFLLR